MGVWALPKENMTEEKSERFADGGPLKEMSLLGIRMREPFDLTEFRRLNDRRLNFFLNMMGVPLWLLPAFLLAPLYLNYIPFFGSARDILVNKFAFAAARCLDAAAISDKYCDSYIFVFYFSFTYFPICLALCIFSYTRVYRRAPSSIKFDWGAFNFFIIGIPFVLACNYLFFFVDVGAAKSEYSGRAKFIIGPMYPSLAIISAMFGAGMLFIFAVYVLKIGCGRYFTPQEMANAENKTVVSEVSERSDE